MLKNRSKTMLIKVVIIIVFSFVLIGSGQLSGLSSNANSIEIIRSGFLESFDQFVENYHDYGIFIALFLLLILIYINNRRIKAERKFKQFEANYKAFITISQDLVFIFSKTGIIEQYYASNPDKLYMPPKEFLGKNIINILPESVGKQFNDALHECLSENKLISIKYNLNVPAGDSSFEARFARTDFDHAIVVISDITDRKSTHSQLQKLQRAFEQAMDEIAVVNMEGNIEFANKAWANAHGYSHKELVGKNLSIFHTKEQFKNQVAPFNKILMERGFNQGEIEHKRKDGTIFPTFMTCAAIRDENGVAIGLVGIARDITERKQAESTIQNSEEKFRKYIASAPYGIFIVDADGRYIEVNSAACDMTGYLESELKKMSIPDIIDHKTHSAELESFEELKRTGSVEIEFRLKRKNGSIIWASLHAVSLSGNRFMAFCSDITDRKKVEEELYRNEEKYRGIFDESVATIYVFDTNKRFLDSNQAGLDLLGYSREELLSMSIADVDADPVVTVPKHKELLSGDSIVNYEHQLRRKDGTIITVLNNSKPLTNEIGEVVGMQSTLIDITERKQAEADLMESEERFRDLAELLPQTLYEMDTKGNITYTNRMGLETFGYDSRDLDKGLNALSLFIPEDHERVIKNIKLSMESVAHVNHEYTAITKNGTPFNVLVYSSPITHNGEVIGLRGVLFDITSLKQAEETIKESEQRYRELADSLPQSVFEIDVEGNILFFNQTGCDSFGYTREELEKGVNALQAFVPEERERVLSNIKKDLTGGKIEDREYTALHTDGTTFQVYAYSNPIIREGRPVGLRGVLVDLTPIKRAEKAIAESEEKYRHLVENVDATICILDYDGNFLFMNGVGAKSHLLEKEDFSDKTIWDIFPKNIAENKMKIVRQVIDSGSEQLVELKSMINGKLCWFYTITQPYAFYIGDKKVALIIAHDITEKKLAEQAVKFSEEKYRLLVNNVSAIISLVDYDGTFNFVNKLAATSLSKPIVDIIGNKMWDLFPQEIAERQMKSIREVIDTRKEIRRETRSFVNGDWRWYDTVIQPYDFDLDNKKMAITISHDTTVRKTAEDALKNSEEKFRYLAEYSVQGIYIIQNGKFVFVNPRGADIAGMKIDELYEMKFVDFMLRGVTPEYQEMAYRKYKERIEGHNQENNYELEYITPSGEKKWIELFTQTCVIDNIDSIYTIVLDNTMKKQAEEALKTSEEKFRYLAENSFQGIFIIQDNRVVFTNQRGAEILGRSLEYLYKTNFNDYIQECLVPEYKELVIERYRARAAGEDVPNHYEFEIYTPSKEIKRLEIYTQKCVIDGIDSFYALINDVTAARHATKALKSSEEKFRNFAEHSLQGVYIVIDNKFTFVNRKASEITGIPINEFLNMDINEFGKRIASDQQDSAYGRYKARMSGDNSETHYECEFITPQGESKWLEFFGQKTIIEGKDALYGIVMDISLRKKAEQDIRNAQRERYNTIREIAGGVSHEMYNALYPAMVALDKLKKNITNDELTEEQKKHLHDMTENAVDRAISMTEEVTHYSRIESEKKVEVFEVNNLIREIIENHKSRIEELEINVTFDLNDKIECLCHKNHAFSIFNNLIINSLDALADVENRKLEIKSTKDKGYVKISIFDSGIGIEKEHLDKIFDPFYSTKPHTGTGLGLAMVKKIIDIYDGKITVNSSLDNGSEFVIFLRTPTLSES